jgi:dTDP-4-dehydrorhamnose reductase
MKSILVTGSKGQLGCEIEGLSYTHSYKGFKFFFTDIDTLDIVDAESVESFFNNQQIDYIINCAGYTMVDKAEDEKDKAMAVNADGVANLLQYAEKQETAFLHISSDYVFDGQNHLPYKEDDKTNPVSAYGLSKRKAEEVLGTYQKSIILRTSWLYSEKGNNFLTTILRISEESKELRVVNDQIGSPTYARDLAKVLLDIILYCENNPENFPAGIYHYSNEGVCSWFDFARAIIRHAGRNNIVVPVETSEFERPAKRPAYSVMNKKKIKSLFNVSITHWEDSLVNCLNQLDY